MRFRTELIIPESKRKIQHSQSIFGVGSCFVNEIGEKISDSKFRTLLNPFGTLFHPLAIENALLRILSLTYYTQGEIFKNEELYFSWDHHTSFDRISMERTLQHINSELEKANEFIQKADVFILTFGSAWVYKLKETGLFVANCHKVPGSLFRKTLLNDSEIRQSLKNCFHLIQDVNPNAHIIATISPVRHVKDGITANMLSKAKLISNLHEVLKTFEKVDYFPAYELLIDDLRDYRFYKPDLVHPNEQAVDYIWNKFSETYFDAATTEKIQLANDIQNALNHRPLNPETIAYKEFLYKTNKQLAAMENQFPKGSFTNEKQVLQKLMKYAD
ncbi:MAG: GSCFA domain-containing protein [Weeksellaceae bacterium]